MDANKCLKILLLGVKRIKVRGFIATGLHRALRKEAHFFLSDESAKPENVRKCADFNQSRGSPSQKCGWDCRFSKSSDGDWRIVEISIKTA